MRMQTTGIAREIKKSRPPEHDGLLRPERDNPRGQHRRER